MSSDTSPHSRFDAMVAEVFARQNFQVLRNQTIRQRDRRVEVDLLLSFNEASTVVEIKTFRTRTPGAREFVRALEIASSNRFAFTADHVVVVTNLRREQLPPLPEPYADAMILCIEDLIWLASGDVQLISDLIESDRELSSALRDFDNPVRLQIQQPTMDMSVLQMRGTLPLGTTLAPTPVAIGKGEEIAIDLEAIPTGSKIKLKLPSGEENVPWRLLEVIGLRAIKYLFDRQFHRWDDQGDVGGDDQRYDVLAKVKGDDVFSSMLVQDFRSRYVLFEFKNYKDPLKPNLVYVTEKYLFPTALRSTAIMISPLGFSPAARAAAHGALRDAGKLFLDLPVPKICKLLRQLDAGTSPDEELEKMLDTHLQEIGR